MNFFNPFYSTRALLGACLSQFLNLFRSAKS